MSILVVTADWQTNSPHLTEKQKAELRAATPKYQDDARTRGIPQLGAGVIFPVDEADFLVDAFPLPKHWPRGYGLDVGWNRTAALWITRDPDTGTKYFYDEHYRSEDKPQVHSSSIRDRGVWIPGKIDPAARGRAQEDGKKLLASYRKEIYGKEDLAVGVRLLTTANNAVETGLYDMLIALQIGKLKVMRNRCPNWLAERRLYRRDEKGRVVKKFDHAMDAGRYAFMSGDGWLLPVPATDPTDGFNPSGGGEPLGWMSHI